MEFVFVIPRSELFPDCYPHGIVPFAADASDPGSADSFAARVAAAGFFVEREYAERTPALKQVIPYTIVLAGDEVMLLRRLAA